MNIKQSSSHPYQKYNLMVSRCHLFVKQFSFVISFFVLTSFFFSIPAPEILDEAQAFPQSDMWSLGVLLYVLLSGQLPFKGETAEETKSNILDVKFKFEWLYNEVTMEATRLLMWIFKRAPWYV